MLMWSLPTSRLISMGISLRMFGKVMSVGNEAKGSKFESRSRSTRGAVDEDSKAHCLRESLLGELHVVHSTPQVPSESCGSARISPRWRWGTFSW